MTLLTNLYSRLYQSLTSKYSATRGAYLRRNVLRWIRNSVLRFKDPEVFVTVGKRGLWMHLSHALPLLRFEHPFYDTLLGRLAPYLKVQQGHLTMIDVGANIGDTVSLVQDEVEGDFLCIEADARHFVFLQRNAVGLRGVTCVQAMLSDVEGAAYGLQEGRGTSHVVQDHRLTGKVVRLDEIISSHSAFQRTNLLKVDTDGFDLKVLRGGVSLLEEARPVLYFELSPRHYVTVGHEDPFAVFPFLAAKGYRHVTFYGSMGYLIFSADLAAAGAMNFIKQILRWAHSTGGYFDILALHASAQELHEGFCEHEKNTFPLINRL